MNSLKATDPEMNRRAFIAAGIGLSLLAVPGCALIGGLFRFGARGGLVRRGAGTARVSPQGSVLTLGRAASTTLQLIRIANAVERIESLQSVGQIVSTETGNVAVDLRAKDDLCETYIDGAAISVSERRGIYSSHYVNLYGRQFEAGRSVAISDNEVEHRDLRDRFLGADRFGKDKVFHYDESQNLKGVTPLQIDRTPGSQSAVVSDDSYLMSELDSAARSARKDYGDGFADTVLIDRMRTECLGRSALEDCDDLVEAANTAMKRLETSFR